MLEKEVETYLIKQVEGKGGKAYKFVSPAHRGVADRIVVLPGGAVWFVEVKTDTGRLSPLQEIFRRDITELGCNYVCVYGAAEVDTFLRYVRAA
jgi:streptogramin lyase